MPGIKQTARCALRSRRGIMLAAAGLAAFAVAIVVIRSLLVFPFDPPVPALRMTLALAAVAIFFAGSFFVMSGRRIGQRLIAAHVMALCVLIIAVALVPDRVAWTVAILGWLTLGGMSLLGGSLMPRTGTGRHGEERPG